MNCKNCDTQLALESSFCNSCGGKVVKKRLTLKNLFEHISETFFNYDNKLLRTFFYLFKKPEVVIDSYVQGVRNRYVNPMGFFGVALTLSGLFAFIAKKFFLSYMDVSHIFDDLFDNSNFQESMANSTDTSLEYSSLIYAALVPIMAIVSVIVFYNKRYNFTEHIVIYLYSMSATSIVSVILGLAILCFIPEKYLAFTIIFYFFMVAYHCYLLKRLFLLKPGQLILKTLLFFVVFLFMYIGVSILFGILMVATGTFDFDAA